VLKGALKPTCLSDTESELGGCGLINAAVAASGVKRQLSEGSAHRSVIDRYPNLLIYANRRL